MCVVDAVGKRSASNTRLYRWPHPEFVFRYGWDTVASWAANPKASIRKAEVPRESANAAPTQDGGSWVSPEHILWPFTRL